MKKFLNIVDYVAIVLLLILVVLLTIGSVLFPITGSASYYNWQYEKHDNLKSMTYSFRDPEGKTIRMEYTDAELEEITDTIIRYLLVKKEDSMQVTVERDGIEYEVFSKQALNHMADVKVLYQTGIVWAIVCVILLGLCIVYFIYRKNCIFKKWFKTSAIAGGVLFLIILAIGIYVLVDFDNAFYIFHKVLFPGDKFEDAYFSTVSNYEEKYYINNLMLILVLNEEMFMDAGIICVATLLIVLVSYFVSTYFISKKAKKIDCKLDKSIA